MPLSIVFPEVSNLGFELPWEESVIVRHVNVKEGCMKDRVDTLPSQASWQVQLVSVISIVADDLVGPNIFGNKLSSLSLGQ